MILAWLYLLIQARHLELKPGLGLNEIIQDIVLRGCPDFY